jgi:hypothetical protein
MTISLSSVRSRSSVGVVAAGVLGYTSLLRGGTLPPPPAEPVVPQVAADQSGPVNMHRSDFDDRRSKVNFSALPPSRLATVLHGQDPVLMHAPRVRGRVGAFRAAAPLALAALESGDVDNRMVALAFQHLRNLDVVPASLVPGTGPTALWDGLYATRLAESQSALESRVQYLADAVGRWPYSKDEAQNYLYFLRIEGISFSGSDENRLAAMQILRARWEADLCMVTSQQVRFKDLSRTSFDEIAKRAARLRSVDDMSGEGRLDEFARLVPALLTERETVFSALIDSIAYVNRVGASQPDPLLCALERADLPRAQAVASEARSCFECQDFAGGYRCITAFLSETFPTGPMNSAFSARACSAGLDALSRLANPALLARQVEGSVPSNDSRPTLGGDCLEVLSLTLCFRAPDAVELTEGLWPSGTGPGEVEPDELERMRGVIARRVARMLGVPRWTGVAVRAFAE